jgi:energy-coupling factor transporter transmembrane protein EcfT
MRQLARPSVAGQAICLMLSLVLAATAPGWRVAVACAVILALALVSWPAGLAALRSPRLWLLLAMLLGSAALLMGDDSQGPAGVALSAAGLATGVEMVLRALGIVVAVSSFASSVSVSDLSQLLERAGLRGLGFALGVAVNMLPTIQRSLTVAYQALSLRGGFRRPWLGVRLLLVTVAANSLRHADDIVGSAEARAFSPERSTASRLAWSAGDAWAIGVLALALGIVWLV